MFFCFLFSWQFYHQIQSLKTGTGKSRGAPIKLAKCTIRNLVEYLKEPSDKG